MAEKTNDNAEIEEPVSDVGVESADEVSEVKEEKASRKPKPKGKAKETSDKKAKSGKKSKAVKKDKPKKDSYVKEVETEMRRVTWPGKNEVAKWALIVIAALAFFTAFTLVSDDFIVTPVMYFISGLMETDEFGILSIILTVLMFLSGILLLIAIMMHSGSDGGGLSDAAATSIAGGANSTAIIERNLDRITIVLAIIFILSLIGLMLVFPQGTISGT